MFFRKAKDPDVAHVVLYRFTCERCGHECDWQRTLLSGKSELDIINYVIPEAKAAAKEHFYFDLAGISGKCKHCGSYFVPPNNRPIEYCDSIAPGQTKPCFAIGPMSTYTDKVKADPILEIYTRAYKRYIARRRKGAISPEDFDKWAAFAKAERARAYEENVSPEDFAELLK